MNQEKLHSEVVMPLLDDWNVVRINRQLILIFFVFLSLQPSFLLHSQDRTEARWKKLINDKLLEIEAAPNNVDLHNEIGNLYEKLGDFKATIRDDFSYSYYKAAMAHYKLAYTLQPLLGLSRHGLQNLEQVRTKLSQQSFEDELQLPPMVFAPSESDVSIARRKLLDNPNDLDAIRKIALHHHTNHEYESAISEYLKIAKAQPNADIYYTLGRLFTFVKDYRKAIEAFQKAIRYQPDIVRVYSGVGYAYYQLANYDNAIVYYLLANGLGREYNFIQVDLAKAYQKKGQLELALSTVKKVIAKDTTDSEAYYVLGSVLFDKNEFQEAANHLKTYLAKQPKGEYVDEVRTMLEKISTQHQSPTPVLEKGVYRFPEWNFEMQADESWQKLDMALLREQFGDAVAGGVLILQKVNTDLMVSVTIKDLTPFPEVKTPQDYEELLRRLSPYEVIDEIEPLEEFTLNEYNGAKRVYTMGGFAIIVGYIFIRDDNRKAYLIGGLDRSAGLARNLKEFRSAFAKNRKELEKVMNTFKFLDIEQIKKDQIKKLLWGENPTVVSAIWGFVGRIPLSSKFGVFFEWVPLFFSIVWIFLWYHVMRGIEHFATATGQPPGCLYAFTQFAQLFYLFCCIRAVF